MARGNQAVEGPKKASSDPLRTHTEADANNTKIPSGGKRKPREATFEEPLAKRPKSLLGTSQGAEVPSGGGRGPRKAAKGKSKRTPKILQAAFAKTGFTR